jgi:hypothetical protein
MTHEQAASLVSEWARGALDASRSADFERHVAECEACRGAAAAARSLVEERERIAASSQRHPSSDALARYVVGHRDEPVVELARVGLHLSRCGTCREDADLMREAALPGWWRSIRAWFSALPSLPRVLQPALAVAAILLAYPAWMGLIEAPRERAAAEARLRAAEEARVRAEAEARELGSRDAVAPRGGGVAALVLRDAVRSAASLPTVRLRAGQDLQPLLLDVAPPAGALTVTLSRDRVPVWSASGPREDFWDEANRLVGVLVPAQALTPGEYSIELRSGTGPPFFVSRFRVQTAR